MSKKNTFQWWWDFESDELTVVVKDFDGVQMAKQSFTKEFLEDCTGKTLIDVINNLIPYTATQALADIQQVKLAAEAAWYQLMSQKHQSKPVVKELHVFDLGEGMLVPCEMMKALASMFHEPSPAWKSLYNDPPIQPPELMKKTLEMLGMYHGKIMHVDADKSPYLTDKDAWFIDDAKSSMELEQQKLDEFVNAVVQHASGPFTGYAEQMMKHAQMYMTPHQHLKSTIPTVSIPKKPAQVTKQSLEYFHKMLGGKKDPYIK